MAHPLTIQEAKDNLRAVAQGLRPTRGELDSKQAKAHLREVARHWVDLPTALARAPWITLGIACLGGFSIGKTSRFGTDLPFVLLSALLRRFLRSTTAGE